MIALNCWHPLSGAPATQKLVLVSPGQAAFTSFLDLSRCCTAATTSGYPVNLSGVGVATVGSNPKATESPSARYVKFFSSAANTGTALTASASTPAIMKSRDNIRDILLITRFPFAEPSAGNGRVSLTASRLV